MSSVPSASSPCMVMSAVRWHMPPVCSCIAFAPASATVCASTSLSMSASMTPMRISSFSAPSVLTSVVVLPLPGELMRFNKNSPRRFSSARTLSASRSLLSNTLCFISIVLSIIALLLVKPESIDQIFGHIRRYDWRNVKRFRLQFNICRCVSQTLFSAGLIKD